MPTFITDAIHKDIQNPESKISMALESFGYRAEVVSKVRWLLNDAWKSRKQALMSHAQDDAGSIERCIHDVTIAQEVLFSKPSQMTMSLLGMILSLLDRRCEHGISTERYQCIGCLLLNQESIELLRRLLPFAARATTTRRFWESLSGAQFEEEVACVFRNNGWTAKVTGGANDMGVDIVLQRQEEVVLVQCKAHQKPVGPRAVRELYGVLVSHHASRALLVSTSGFSSSATAWAEGKPLELLELSDIIRMAESR